ncbi:hypothetical protein EDB80DRAFT_888448 [Ilyonectria destructans]|nr:hypothetical protein EDB80DRAFT_888448 [Ilyonectria destructans]
MQNHYDLLYREEEREMNRYCNLTGVGLIPALASSIARTSVYSGIPQRQRPTIRYHDRNTDRIISRIEQIPEKRNWLMSHASLAWLNRRVTAPIIGYSTVKRIDEALATRGLELSEDENRYLEELYLLKLYRDIRERENWYIDLACMDIISTIGIIDE